MRKAFYSKPSKHELLHLTRRDPSRGGNMWTLEKKARESLSKIYSWEDIDSMMMWITDQEEWYKIEPHKIKALFEAKVSDGLALPKNCGFIEGFNHMHRTYISYQVALSYRITLASLKMKNYSRILYCKIPTDRLADSRLNFLTPFQLFSSASSIFALCTTG